MVGLSTKQEKELMRLQTDTHEGCLRQEEFIKLLKSATAGVDAVRLGLSDDALKREASEAARRSRRERHLKVLERRQESQQAQEEEAEEARKEAHARASHEAANARAEAAAAALLAEE